MRILYLCDHKYYITKMSRIRFHTIREMAKTNDLIYSGPNWSNWRNSKTAKENIDRIYKKEKPDLVIGFKPLEINGFKDIEQRTCIRYNEMFDQNSVINEIVNCLPNIIVCHHYNDYMEWSQKLSNITAPYDLKLIWIPHSIDTDIFKPCPISKEYDLAIMGATHVNTLLGSHYPLRERMCSLIYKMPSKYKCKIFSHVGGSHLDSHTDKYVYDFAQKLNSCKILITCSGVPRSRFAKYIEAPACGTAVAGDLYDDHPDDIIKLKDFLIEIDLTMDDQTIIDKLVYYLENEEELNKKISVGLEYVKDFSLNNYVERFLKQI